RWRWAWTTWSGSGSASCPARRAASTSTSRRDRSPLAPPAVRRLPRRRGLDGAAGGVELAQDLPQALGGVLRGQRVHAQPLHGGDVTVHVVPFVQVEGAVELLDVDHVRQLLVGEAQDG